MFAGMGVHVWSNLDAHHRLVAVGADAVVEIIDKLRDNVVRINVRFLAKRRHIATSFGLV